MQNQSLLANQTPMRYFYTFLFYLALPFIFIRLLWRGRQLPAYRKRLGERMGYYPFTLQKSIWVHAVSVGEVLAAIPLIKALKSRHPNTLFLVTTMTPTGADRVKVALGKSVYHAYIPYDVPDAMSRFLKKMNPIVAIIMETELWPNLIASCNKKQIPICLVNARLSEKSAKGYARIAGLTRNMLQKINIIAAHGEKDAERFVQLGAPKDRISVTGNIKFDLELPQQLVDQSKEIREKLGRDRFIWIAASTHEGEEEKILAAHRLLLKKYPEALLILVPRHPDRFDAVMKLCEQSAFKTVRRSLSSHSFCEEPLSEMNVYLGDTMGELLLLYGVSDVAFVGGSLVSRGGHNMLEPGALGKPILTGPYLFNFAEISELFVSANALIKVPDEKTLAEQLDRFIKNPDERTQTGKRALRVMDANRGALQKQLELIEKVLMV